MRKSLIRDKSGATMLEYAIVVGLIAMVAIGGVTVFGSNLHGIFQAHESAVSGINSTATSN
jgi:pilus assembly protein Flp/PilA